MAKEDGRKHWWNDSTGRKEEMEWEMDGHVRKGCKIKY